MNKTALITSHYRNINVVLADMRSVRSAWTRISLRHDAYQITALAAAKSAEVLHGCCFQLTSPLRWNPVRLGGLSSPQSSGFRGPEGPSDPPAAPASRLPSIAYRQVCCSTPPIAITYCNMLSIFYATFKSFRIGAFKIKCSVFVCENDQ